MTAEDAIRQRYNNLYSTFNEKQKRLWAASEALNVGRGGVTLLQNITGLSRSTIHIGIKELENKKITDTPSSNEPKTTRRQGGGRKIIEHEQPGLLAALKDLVEPTTKGDPMKALLWTCKSTKNISRELEKQGFNVSDRTVSRLLYDLGYSLQSNFKSLEGKNSLIRNEQFESDLPGFFQLS
jgi:transposase